MQVLITRPREDAEPLAERLRARGVDAIVAPLLIIRPDADASPDLGGVQAIVLTSANGARALAAASDRRDVPVYAVGDATARAARDLGFAPVASAGGDVDDLAKLVIARLDPGAGALLHAAGSRVAGDLAGRLGAAGFVVRRAVLYGARKVEKLPEAAAAALLAGTLDAALFFSPRSAASFDTLVREAAFETHLAGVRALCLSAAVAERLRGLAWREVRVAARPEQEELLRLIDELNAT